MSGVALEPLDRPHAEALHRLWSDPEVVRFTNWELSTSLDDTGARLERLRARYAEEPKRLGPWVACDDESGLVGLAGIDFVGGEHELWYLVRRDLWGRGYGSAMVACMIDEASARGLRGLVATAVAANEASWRLLERHGFTRVATQVAGFRRNGVVADLHRYERRPPPRRPERPPPDAWDDLALPPAQRDQLREIARRVAAARDPGRKPGRGPDLRRGTPVLFAGDAGTGKTLAAKLLAAELKRPLQRVDLAAVVGRYVGETEKNLARLFEDAERHGAVLLFEDADELFARKGEVRDAHDRYARLEPGYLMQRIEDYPGLAILLSRRRDAIEPALLRRLATVVEFPGKDRRT